MLSLDSKSDSRTLVNISASALIEESIKNDESYLSADGVLCSAESDPTNNRFVRFVVDESSCSESIYWNDRNIRCSPVFFDALWDKVENHIIHKDHYVNHFEVGENSDTYTPFESLTESAFHSLFLSQYYFTPDDFNVKKKACWQLLHAPSYVPDSVELASENSEYAIAICFAQRKIIIAGLNSTEAIKHTLFSIQSFLLLEKGILGFSGGIALTLQKQALVFIGSHDSCVNQLLHSSDLLISNDEYLFWQKHNLSCASSSLQIKSENINTHPKYRNTRNLFHGLLENQNHDTHSRECIDNSDTSTEVRWTCASSDYHKSIKRPKAVFFVVHDVFDALPPLALLDLKAAEKYFLAGYNSAFLSDEKSPAVTETFSHAQQNFSELRRPSEFQKLFKKRLKNLECPIFLINSHRFLTSNDADNTKLHFDSNLIEFLLSESFDDDTPHKLNPFLQFITPTDGPSQYFKNMLHSSKKLEKLWQQMSESIALATEDCSHSYAD